MNFHIKRSKKRFIGFLAIAIRKKTFFYPFYVKNKKNLKKSKIDFLFLPGSFIEKYNCTLYFFVSLYYVSLCDSTFYLNNLFLENIF